MDQLVFDDESITDNDFIIAILSGLPADFDMIEIVILARDSTMSLKDYRAQLFGLEATIESRMHSLINSMSAMYVEGEGSNSHIFQGGYQRF